MEAQSRRPIFLPSFSSWKFTSCSLTAGLHIYFWISFIPAVVSKLNLSCLFSLDLNWTILVLIEQPWFHLPKIVMLVGTKLQHVVSSLALEIVEQSGPSVGIQLKPRDDLFWFGKPEILLRLIQFIIFQVSTHDSLMIYVICFVILFLILFCFFLMQNAFEMATFIWSLVKRLPLFCSISFLSTNSICMNFHLRCVFSGDLSRDRVSWKTI